MAGQIMEQICLDTSVCIEILRGNEQIQEEMMREGNGTSYVSSMTIFELFLRKDNLHEIDSFMSDVFVLGLDELGAKKASSIEKELKQTGNMISREDIFIAATAIVNNCALATLNVKDFSRIKGLKLVKLQE